MTWKTRSSTEVYRNAWMHVTEDEVETDFGVTLTYGVVHKKACALIIPRDGEIYTLVGQYRYPIRQFSWEFPQGHFIGDSITETAVTELKEETGLTAGSLIEIGSFFIAPGVHNQRCHVFLATKLDHGETKRESGEQGMETKQVTMKKLLEMVNSEVITDGLTLSALSLLSLYDMSSV